MPSTGEAFGIVFLEAWAVGKPVIGARTQAVSSVIADGSDGYLISPGDAGDLATHIARMLGDPKLAQQMGTRGRAKVMSRYTVSRIADIVEGVYFRTLRWHRHRTRSEQRASSDIEEAMSSSMGET
jgi:glycosyltransferase involved in cell wall biosynthesis